MHPRRTPHRLAWTAALCLTGCPEVLGPPGDTPRPTDHGAPTILTLSLACDATAEAWDLTVTTDAWSGGGELVWSVDGAYLERHPFLSVAADPAGAGDTLGLELAIARDWREVTFGSSTAFPCAADPNAVVVIDALDGTPSDCRRLGPNPEALDGIEGVPACVTATR